MERFKRATDTIKELLLWYVVTIVTATVLFSYFEAKNLWDSLWWAVVTGMTIGYGDIYPETNGGRLVAIGLVFTMLFIILPMYTARLAAKFIVEEDAFTSGEQEQIKALLTKIDEQTKK